MKQLSITQLKHAYESASEQCRDLDRENTRLEKKLKRLTRKKKKKAKRKKK